VEKVWKSENPNSPFEFQFLDDAMNRRYTADRKTEQIFGGFAFVALVISCLGAFGLASYTAETRQKKSAYAECWVRPLPAYSSFSRGSS